MIEFKIKGQEYKIEDITIRQYYEIQDLIVRQDFAAKIEIVSKISGCAIENLKLLEKHQFIVLWDSIVQNYLNLEDSTPFHKNILFNGKLYGFLDMNKITLGEFADMDVLRTDPMSQKKLHQMMSILYRPAIQISENWMEVDPYDSDVMVKQAEEFLDLPVKYVAGSLNFFLAVSKYYVETTLSSLTQTPTLTLRQKAIADLASQIILDQLETGAKSYTSVQATILPKLEKLHELARLEYLTTSHIEETNTTKKSWLGKRLLSQIKDKITWR